MTNKEYLAEDTRNEEGLRLESYIEKISGKWHIAYGHLLEQDQSESELEIMGLEEELDNWEGFTVTEEQAEALLQQDIQDAIDSLAPTWSVDDLEALDRERYVALISMTFQMGGHKVQNGFPSFVKAVLNEDWDRAADEMMWSNGLKKQRRSRWYKQTPDRCQLMADRMRNGTPNEVPIKTESIDTPVSVELGEVPTHEIFANIDAHLNELKSRLES